MTRTASELRDQAAQACRRAVEFLAHMQNWNGSLCATPSLWDVWETVLITRVLVAFEDAETLAENEVIQRALGFLRESEQDDGILFYTNDQNPEAYLRPWPPRLMMDLLHLYRQNPLDIPFDAKKARIVPPPYRCFETTSEYTLLLRALDGERTSARTESLVRAVAGYQRDNGCWPIGNPLPEYIQEYPSVTGAVLDSLAGFEPPGFESSFIDRERALHYLVSTQNERGHWGADWMWLGTPYYPMHFILSALAKHERTECMDAARRFLLSRQQPDGSWYYQLNGWGPLRSVSAELQTALALLCCYACGIALDDPVVTRGVEFLLATQMRHGQWYGGFYAFPPQSGVRKQEDLFATVRAVQALDGLCERAR